MAQRDNTADKALAAFVIIQGALKRSRRLQAYSVRKELNDRMPHFQVCPCPGLCAVVLDDAVVASTGRQWCSFASPSLV